MKRKDLVMLVIAVVILLGSGYVAYTQLFASKNKSKAANGTEVEVVGTIPASLDATGLSVLDDPTKTVDFTPSIDLTTGLGTAAPFGN